jgi:hypothetical protein
MKNIISKSNLTGLILSTFALIAFTSCSKKMHFSSSSVVPAAVGTVKIKSDKNKNHTVDVSVSNLAPASQLTPSKKVYVVWIVTQENQYKNIGQLNSSSGFLSKALKASLTAVTPFTPVSVFITAENEGDVEYPGMTVVLTTR